LLDLLVQGFTVVPGVLSEDRIARAKAAMVRRAETVAERKIEPDTATSEDFNGAKYLHYMLFDDPVFPEILLEPNPLALITYLLGENCLLSSMGCHDARVACRSGTATPGTLAGVATYRVRGSTSRPTSAVTA